MTRSLKLIAAAVGLEDRDVVVVAHKAVSKDEGRVVRLEARHYSSSFGFIALNSSMSQIGCLQLLIQPVYSGRHSSNNRWLWEIARLEIGTRTRHQQTDLRWLLVEVAEERN